MTYDNPPGVIKIFWSIKLNDVWSKKICIPKMIVWSGAIFILRWSCFDVEMLFFDLLSTFWISILLICLIFFRQHSLNKTYVVLVAKQMLKHLRIAKKNCPLQVSWQVKFKCRYVFVVSLSVRFLSIVITCLCWYPKLPLLYYFVFPIVTQKICCLETIPSCVNSTSLSFKLFF